MHILNQKIFLRTSFLRRINCYSQVSFLFFSEKIDVIGEYFHSFRVIDPVQLFVLRVRSVVARSHRQQKNRLFRHFFENKRD
jgi:hypothetical protein